MRTIIAAVVVSVCLAGIAPAQESQFPGLENVMDANTYRRAGLEKLSPEQRETLDAFLRDYVANKQKAAAEVAAASAVDQAVKERKVRAPELIESSIVGDFRGSPPRTLFRLANGQVWKPTDPDPRTRPAIASPKVVIYRDMFGYKMFVEGAGIIRVKRAD